MAAVDGGRFFTNSFGGVGGSRKDLKTQVCFKQMLLFLKLRGFLRNSASLRESLVSF